MRRLIAALCALAASAPAALAAADFFLKVSPSTVQAGKTVRVLGSVGTECPSHDEVIVHSWAFKGATTSEFAGIPALIVKQDKHHRFSAKVTIKRSIEPGSYYVGPRCGGGTFTGAILKVTMR